MRVFVCVGFLALLGSAPSRAADPPPADLEALLAEAGAANLDVQSLAARARAAVQLPGQLEALPDPKLSVSYTNDTLDDFTLGSSEFSNLSIGWEQEVPSRASRARAADVARAEVDTAYVATDVARVSVRARIVSLYADLYRIDRSRALIAEMRETLSAELAAGRVRYESGEGIQEGLLRAGTEIRKLDLDSEALRRERAGVEIALGEVLGRVDAPSFGAAAALPEGRLPDDPSVLSGAAVSGAPDVREAEARTRRAEAAVEYAKAQSTAEFSWVAAYQYRGGLDPMVMGGFGVRLPVWKDRKQERAVSASRSALEAARLEGERAARRTAAAARSLVNDVESAERALTLYNEAILPQDLATVEAARAAFSAGMAPMSLLLDDLRRWFDDRIAALALETRRVQALASLESVAGVTLLDVAAAGRTR